MDTVGDVLGSLVPAPFGPAASKGISWVGHKVGDWFGLTGEKRSLPVPTADFGGNNLTTMTSGNRATTFSLPNPLSTFNQTPMLGPAV